MQGSCTASFLQRPNNCFVLTCVLCARGLLAMPMLMELHFTRVPRTFPVPAVLGASAVQVAAWQTVLFFSGSNRRRCACM